MSSETPFEALSTQLNSLVETELSFSEESVDVKSSIGSKPVNVNVGKDLKGHLDLGFHSVGPHFLNPYLKLTVPRKIEGGSKSSGKTTLGTVLHFASPSPRSPLLRAQVQASFEDSPSAGSQIDLKQNFSLTYRKMAFGAFNSTILGRNGWTSSVGTLNLGLFPDHTSQTFLAADFVDFRRVSGASAGFMKNFRLGDNSGLQIYSVLNRFFEHKKPVIALGGRLMTFSEGAFYTVKGQGMFQGVGQNSLKKVNLEVESVLNQYLTVGIGLEKLITGQSVSKNSGITGAVAKSFDDIKFGLSIKCNL